MDNKPIEYILEIRIGSMENHPICQIKTESPFSSISIGDGFAYSGPEMDAVDILEDGSEVFTIVDKLHIISPHKNFISHKLIVCIEQRENI